RAPQMGQRELRHDEDADDVQFEEGAELVGREVVDGTMRRMPAGVVDQAVDAAFGGDRAVDRAADVILTRDIARDESRASGAGRRELRRERFAARAVR